MSPANRHGLKSRIAEQATALILVGVIVFFHVTFLQNAGGLWRDEVDTAALATLPDMGAVIELQKLESYPLFTTLTLRAWDALGGGTADADLRVFGMLVGLAVLGMLWLNARLFGHRLPVVGMLLLGLNPLVLRTCDSIRPYGLGILFSLLALGLFWRAATAPNARRVGLAAVAGVVMVHCSYQNAFLLLAVCLGAVAVCMREKRRKRAALIVGMGLTAALSMIPYLFWNLTDAAALHELPSGSRVLAAAAQAFGSPGPGMARVWVLMVAAGLALGLAIQAQTWEQEEKETAPKDLMLYALVVAAASTLGCLLFLRAVNLYTHPWHLAPLIVMLAACLDTLLGHWKQGAWPRAVLTILILAIFGQAAWQGMRVRQTNLDLVAARLEQTAKKRDLILVYPFWYGPTLNRYYHGQTPLVSIPPIEDQSLQRFDLLREKMTAPDASMAPVLSRITRTLKSGNSVWVVGMLPRIPPGETLIAMPPAPHPETGWYNRSYINYWGKQASLVLVDQAKERRILGVSLNQAVNPYEDVKVEFASGMKDE